MKHLSIPQLMGALGLIVLIGSSTYGIIQIFATKSEVQAMSTEMFAEFDRRSLGSLINDLRIAIAVNDQAAIRQICWEITQLTGKVHPSCAGR